MKNIQFFNLKRFGKYAACSLISNYRQTLLFWGAIWFAIFAFTLMNIANSHSFWNNDNWVPLFISVYCISGLLYTGFAFPAFRNKKRTYTELMIPVTAFERLVYEFIEKIVAFIILFPPIFYLSSSMAVGIRNFLSFASFGTTHVEVNGITTFPFEVISFDKLYANMEPGLFGMLFMLSVLGFVLAFAGAASFRKLPLIKTIVFVGLIFLTGIGYMYMLLEKLDLHNPWLANFEHNITAKQGFAFGSLIFGLISLIALAYTYFKLKEKEAS
ncbi:MAG: hypothetical protein JXR50_08270 [Prolixibacteraceae bacterium]|nr:hypothetical protein [Prolixibacteraceae bacterium]MBN2649719.1 hypothetical protein [Prolixibacteraceae bacterium]